MAYKGSQYNNFLHLGDAMVVYNSYSGALVELDDELMENYALAASGRSADAAAMADMLAAGLIVEDGVDELEALESEYRHRGDSLDSLNLIIAPTLACNFACPYCYEKRGATLMGEHVMIDVVGLVEANAQCGRDVSVMWYGGEPALGKRVVEDLTSRVRRVCARSGVGYEASMVSNGYLLDDAAWVMDMGIGRVEITLDGMRETHDFRRRLAQGGGTFDRIVKNVGRLLGAGVEVNLRVNADKGTVDEARSLVDYLLGCGMESFDVHLGLVKDFTPAGLVRDGYLSMEEFAHQFVSFHQFLWSRGLRECAMSMMPTPKVNACTLDAPNSFVIDPEGRVYKCIAEIGDVSRSIASVSDALSPELGCDRVNPFGFSECVECKMLPVCMGGCLRAMDEGFAARCEVWRYAWEECVRACLMMAREAEEPGLS